MAKKTRSEKQAAANRANAALSTGPRTEQGKSVSSKNATSHGLYAATVVVHHWESKSDFDQLRQDYGNRFLPIDRTESDIVNRLVDSTWRRNRAISIETTLLNLEIGEMSEEIEKKYEETEDGRLRVALAFLKKHAEGVWDAINRHLAAADRAYQRALRDLRLLQGERFNQMPENVHKSAEIVEITERSQPQASKPSKPTMPMPVAANQPEIVEITPSVDSNAQAAPKIAA